ncbi:MAG: hypothetical protein CMP23_17795 [Rickettsiales bacterium]|nr:hypothetical protein [Rickettsiales bacterium]
MTLPIPCCPPGHRILFCLWLFCATLVACQREPSQAQQQQSAQESSGDAQGDSPIESEQMPQPKAAEPPNNSKQEVPTSNVQVLKLPSPRTQDRPTKRGMKRWLGLSVANMSEAIPGAPEEARAQIQRAARGSPAHRAGLRRGDVITAARGQPVKRFQDYLEQARALEIGEELILQIHRNGRSWPVSLEMMSRPTDLNNWKRKAFPGTRAFPFSLPGLRPAKSQFKDQSAHLQLLYFWATWCGPCRQIAPLLDDLHKEAKGKVQVLAISSEERTVLERYLRNSTTNYPVVHDRHGTLKQDYEVRKLPTAALTSGQGEVLAWDYGLGGVHRVIRMTRARLTSRSQSKPH